MEGTLLVRHTANAGVLIRTGDTAIGIDLFSRDPQGLYEDTPKELGKELLGEIEKGRIGTLLFTHEHGDHFCLETVSEALERNPYLTVISTETVAAQLGRAIPQAGNRRAVLPLETENRKFSGSGWELEVFNSVHMGEQYARIQNLVCMLKLGEKRIVFPGDAAPSPELFARIGRWSPEVDLMIAPFPLFGIPTNRKMMAEHLRIREALAVHLPRPEKDAQNWTASAKTVCGRAKDGLPMPVFAEEPGRVYVFGAVSEKKP